MPSPGKTTAPGSVADWSEGDFNDFLKTGDLPNGDRASCAMARVIRNTAQLGDDGRAAMAVYLKSLPPIEGPAQPLVVSKQGVMRQDGYLVPNALKVMMVWVS